MTARVSPKATTTAASGQARRRISPVTSRRSPRAPSTASSTAAVHSRSPVTAAGGTWLNSRAARPAPTCTETTPVRTRIAGGVAPSAASTLAWVTAALLPAEYPRGHADRDGGPGQQHDQVAHGQPARVLQYRMQAVGQRPGRQQPQHRLDAGREFAQREDHPADAE